MHRKYNNNLDQLCICLCLFERGIKCMIKPISDAMSCGIHNNGLDPLCKNHTSAFVASASSMPCPHAVDSWGKREAWRPQKKIHTPEKRLCLRGALLLMTSSHLLLSFSSLLCQIPRLPFLCHGSCLSTLECVSACLFLSLHLFCTHQLLFLAVCISAFQNKCDNNAQPVCLQRKAYEQFTKCKLRELLVWNAETQAAQPWRLDNGKNLSQMSESKTLCQPLLNSSGEVSRFALLKNSQHQGYSFTYAVGLWSWFSASFKGLLLLGYISWKLQNSTYFKRIYCGYFLKPPNNYSNVMNAVQSLLL